MSGRSETGETTHILSVSVFFVVVLYPATKQETQTEKEKKTRDGEEREREGEGSLTLK